MTSPIGQDQLKIFELRMAKLEDQLAHNNQRLKTVEDELKISRLVSNRATAEQVRVAQEQKRQAHTEQLLQLYTAMKYITNQIDNEQMIVTTRMFALEKFEQIIMQLGGVYRPRGTMQTLRQATGCEGKTVSTRMEILDLPLARARAEMTDYKSCIYQVRYHCRAIELEEFYTMTYRLYHELERVGAVGEDKPIQIPNRDFHASYALELQGVRTEISRAESRKYSLTIREDKELGMQCSPNARDLVLPVARIPNDILARVQASVDDSPADIDEQIEQKAQQQSYAVKDTYQWWLDKGIVASTSTIPVAMALYESPNNDPQTVWSKAASSPSTINPHTMRTYKEDAEQINKIIDGTLPDCLPKGQSLYDLPEL